MVKEAIYEPAMYFDDEYTFNISRILGKQEMIGGHRWVERPRCPLCTKQTFCLLMWNKRLSYLRQQKEYYSHTDVEPLRFLYDEYKHPLVVIKDEIHKMVPIREFYERLLLGQKEAHAPVRVTTDGAEDATQKQLEDSVAEDFEVFKKIEPSFWHACKQVRRVGTVGQAFELTKMTREIVQALRHHAHFLLDLEDYAH